jgi:propanol-preferring alcohol dehydrogenase
VSLSLLQTFAVLLRSQLKAELSCEGVTTYKTVKMSGARSSDLVAIFGIGGLGHLAVQYAKIAGATVVAVDLVDEKFELAKKLGADYTVNGKAEDPVEAIKKLGGADAVVCVAVGARVYEQAFKALRRLEQVNEAMEEVEHARIPARLVFDMI